MVPGTGTGKRITSEQSRVQRCQKDWITRALNDNTPLQLRSVPSKDSLLLKATLLPAHSPTLVHTPVLIDSGCTPYGFITQRLVDQYKLPSLPVPTPRRLNLADGRCIAMITRYIITDLTIGNHTEQAMLYIANLESPVILGLPWLRCHNPVVDWRKMCVSFTSQWCQANCLHNNSTTPAPCVRPQQGKPIVRALPTRRWHTPFSPVLTPIPELPTPRRPTPQAVPLVAGQRRPVTTRRPPKQAQTTSHLDPLDEQDIAFVNAAAFYTLSRQKGVHTMRTTLGALEEQCRPKQSIEIPKLPKEDFRQIVTGTGDLDYYKSLLPDLVHDFLSVCFA
jgi:predicted aspartyl protease